MTGGHGHMHRAQQTLMFDTAGSGSCDVILDGPNYRLFAYEEHLAAREAAALVGTPTRNVDVAGFVSDDIAASVSAAKRLAFWHSVETPGDGSVAAATWQCLLECARGGKRKHSTYATHGLHRYKGKFYPQLAKALLNLSQLPAQGALIVDAFGGSGTVMLESVLNGHDAVSIDCNPLAAAVARSKIDVLDVDVDDLGRCSEVLCEQVTSTDVADDGFWDQFAAATHDELASWFAPRVLAKLGVVLRCAREAPDPRMVAFYEVIVSDLVRAVSQQDQRDLRTRRRRDPISDAAVVELFTERLRACVAKIVDYHNISGDLPERGAGCAVLASSAHESGYERLDRQQRPIDCVVSSPPPHATALPYLDTDRLSLAAVFGLSTKQRSDLETSLIGSRETSKKEMATHEEAIVSGFGGRLPPSTVSFLQELLAAARADDSAGFRKLQTPTVLSRYFLGVAAVLAQVTSRVASGAHLWFVLGDSRTNLSGEQWVIPTVDEFSAIGESAGLELVERIPISVTREDVAHAKHSITQNTVIHMQAP